MGLEKQYCVILAAGEGKRMNSSGSKVLCEVAFKPLLLWVIDAVRCAGMKDICVVASGDDVRQAALGCEIVEQKERLGTGHAVLCAREKFAQRKGSILVLYGDAPFIDAEIIEESYDRHLAEDNDVTVISAIVPDARGYGRIFRSEGSMAAIIEEADCTDEQRRISEINTGAYWFKAQSLSSVLDEIGNSNAQGEYYLTDAVSLLLGEGKRAGCHIAMSSDIALGANTPRDLLMLNRIAKDKVISRLLDEGVRFINTDGICIHPDTVIAPGTTVLPGCILKQGVVVGADCVLGPNTTLSNTKIGQRSVVDSCLCNDSVVGDDVRLGPWVQLRPGSVIGNEAKVGNFVEVKNSSVGTGTSVAHLTYVGDADVGAYCNFGCGTVFVNYDGEQKYRTVVKDYAFIGCNTNLVAPVTVGEGAYTSAGVTVTEDVPDGALAIGRAKQLNKPGWSQKKLEKYIQKKQTDRSK